MRPNQEDGPGRHFDPYLLLEGDVDQDDVKIFKDVDPDELKGNGYRPQSIIYTDRLYLDPDHSGRSHVSFFNRGMSKTAQAMQADLSRHLDLGGTERTGQPKRWFDLYDRFLFGRLAFYHGRQLVSFWGRGANLSDPNAKGPTELIKPCIAALVDKGSVTPDTVVVYGDGRVAMVADVLGMSAPGDDQIDQEALERSELAKRMHLAGSDEKKAIMKRLGVGGGGSKKRNSWDAALRKAGKIAPGQNVWRMTSETRQVKLDKSLDDLSGSLELP